MSEKTLAQAQLLIEYKNLKTNCPTGMYLLPKTLHEWHGTYFVHKGMYKEAIIKFMVLVPIEYPLKRPRVKILTPIIHPLIKDGFLDLDHGFPNWRPSIDFISHVLFYIKQSLTSSFLDSLQQAPNLELLDLYHRDPIHYRKLVAQSCQDSSSANALFQKSDFLIQYQHLDDSAFITKRLQLYDSIGIKTEL
ncbi:ubiquitin-conjugating enzyme/RWD-like protein [Gorgonomyces haynaldii]|nr:ubiquitin-conjugating enzyme/RWD-like protein [Gorgonomyces haynaldii]